MTEGLEGKLPMFGQPTTSCAQLQQDNLASVPPAFWLPPGLVSVADEHSVQKLLKIGHFLTLFNAPSFWTVVQIQTGDNFRRVWRSSENEGILLANLIRLYFTAPKSLYSDELTLPV